MSRAPGLTKQEAAALFADAHWAAKFPPLLSVSQAAELMQVPPNTIYAWSSAGRLNGCKCRAGKDLRIFRDKLMQLLSEGKINESGS